MGYKSDIAIFPGITSEFLTANMEMNYPLENSEKHLLGVTVTALSESA
jgi:hypothetical protein